MTHTPGPWIVKADSTTCFKSLAYTWALWPIRGGRGDIAYTFENDIDNARLIAAAPDLLAACEQAVEDLKRLMRYEVLDWTGIDIGRSVEAKIQAEAAIAKAKGEAP